MSEKHILCGFDVPEFEKRMKALLKEKGIEATTYIQLSKKGVKDFLDQNPKCDTVILLEASNLKKSYTAEEIAALTDKRDINVIVVLSSRHIGTDYMKTLYVAGVTNAIFQLGRHDGASAKDIVELVLNKRNRLEARKYYGIEHLDLDPTVMMDRDTYTECMERMHQDENLLLNYLQVCSDMSPKQIADFTKRMPAEDSEYLAQFEEFHQLISALKKMGVTIKVKRPKKTKIGLNVTPQICVNDGALTFANNEELFHMQPQSKPVEEPLVENAKVEKPKAVKEPVFSEDMFEGMSMEELLLAAESAMLFVEEPEESEVVTSEQDEASKAALEEAKRLEEEALETQRKLALEQEKLENERKAFEQSKKEAQKELQKEEKRLQSKAQEVEKQAQKTKEEEEKAKKRREKEAREEIERRRREEAERVRRKEQEKDDDEDEDAELFTSEKQFSGGLIVLLLLACGLVAAGLFALPYLKQLGLF